jgi:hypothetical protein
MLYTLIRLGASDAGALVMTAAACPAMATSAPAKATPAHPMRLNIEFESRFDCLLALWRRI